MLFKSETDNLEASKCTMIFLRRNQFIEKRLPLFASSKRIEQEFEDARLQSEHCTLIVLGFFNVIYNSISLTLLDPGFFYALETRGG